MNDVNKIILVGRLGKDPVRRETKTGKAVTHFPLATSRKFYKDTDQPGSPSGEETQWHSVVTWGKQAELCAEYLRKGNPVYLEGSIRSHKYTGKDGVERMSFEVTAEHVNFLPHGGVKSRAERDLEAAADSVVTESMAS